MKFGVILHFHKSDFIVAAANNYMVSNSFHENDLEVSQFCLDQSTHLKILNILKAFYLFEAAEFFRLNILGPFIILLLGVTSVSILHRI